MPIFNFVVFILLTCMSLDILDSSPFLHICITNVVLAFSLSYGEFDEQFLI